MGLRGLGILNYYSWKLSGEKNFIKNYVTKDDNFVFFDVGANIGQYTNKVLEQNSTVKAYLFEPNPNIFQKLKILQSENIKLYNYALGASPSTLKLYDLKASDSGTHGTLYKDVITEIHNDDHVTYDIEVKTIDEICDGEKVNHINLLKIDVEGHELEVLKGAQNIINQGAVDTIHIEFNEMNVYSRVFLDDFNKILPNYKAYRLVQDGQLPLDKYVPVYHEIFAYQNIVFVKNDN
jgi:FkbM family methyltransferase